MTMRPEVLAVIMGIALVLVVVWSLRLYLDGVSTRVASVSRIEGKLDLLLKQAGLTYDPYKNLSPLVADAVKRGKKIEAIKCYRAESGAGLKEAKEFIEEVQRRAGIM